MSLPAIVLAAGASRRLGQPKQLVSIAGETLLERTIRVVEGAGCTPVCVVLGAQVERIQREVEMRRIFAVKNDRWEEGMASSIHAGVHWLREHVKDASGVLLLVCDQPRLSVDHLSALITRYDAADSTNVVASSYAGIRGVPAVFPRAKFDVLLELHGDQGARRLLHEAGRDVIDVAFESAATDIDTAEDLEKYLAEISDAPSVRSHSGS